MRDRMKQQVIDKIEHEYKLFKMAYIVTSRENIFHHAEEISIKKSIYLYLKKHIVRLEDTEALRKLAAYDNIIDTMYGFVYEQYDFKNRKFDEWYKKCKEGQL